MEKLAINGGTPVRTAPFPATYPGASVYGDEEANAVYEVVKRRAPFRYYGPDCLHKAKEFETAFSAKMGTKFTLGVTSGTAALMVALKAAGIGPGDKVIVPACTFTATPGAVICAGAVPVFADIDDSMSIDPEAIGKCVDKYTKAIIPVPILGNPCQMDKIMEQAKKYNLIVIEDVAQSCGSKFKGQYSGTFGDIGCFSMQVNKILCTGDGGMVSTNNEKLYERAVRYHDQGMFREKEGFMNTNENDDIFTGQNFRMSEITAAVALEQVKKLDIIVSRMRKNKKLIKDGIKDIKGLKFRRINDEDGDASNSLIMLLPTKDKTHEFIEALSAEGIPVGCLYNGEPIYMEPQILKQKTVDKSGFPFNQFEEKIVYTPDMCPNAVDIMARNVLIQIGPEITEADAQDVIKAVRKISAQIL
jgi:8-amino-3,8-dideoxy-alpha-D-manno-octulosonate transaminase